MTTIVTNPVTLGAGVPDATTIETDLKFLIIQTIASTLTFQEAPLALVKSNLLAGALAAVNNLSDLADPVAARENLGARNFSYLFSTTAPSGTFGIVGDIVINDNGIIYEKTAATTWTTRVDIATSAELTTAITNHVASSDPHPLYLTQTEGDVRYAPLGESPGSGARYLFDVSTVITGVGTGEIRFNNTTASLVTSITISELDRNGGAMATFLDLISAGSKLQVSFDASEETYAWFNVTAIVDNGVFRTFTVTHIASAGTRANGEVTLGIFGSAGSSLTVREVDGTPSIAASVIEFPNGSLTDQGGGVARLTLSSGGASGIQYTYNDADPPTASGQIRTLQASLNVATAVAINAADVNGDSATDITARLKTGSIFTIAKDAANYVRFEATADYTSGSVAVVVRAEQGAISSGDTVFLAISSGAPSAPSGGAELVWSVVTTAPSSTAGNGYIANAATELAITTPLGPLTPGSTVFGVGNSGTGGFKLSPASGQIIMLGSTLIDTASKHLTNNNQSALVLLRALSATTWIVESAANVIFGQAIAGFTRLLIRANEAAGSSTVADLVVPGRTITLNGTASVVSGGKFGNALRIGANNTTTGTFNAEFTMSDSLGTQDFCIEAWIDSVAGTLFRAAPFSFARAGVELFAINFQGGVGGASQPQLLLGNNGTSGQATASGAPTTALNTGYHHYAISRQANVWRMFIDGVKYLESSIVYDFLTTPFTVRIGNRYASGLDNSSCNGDFDEVRISIGDPIYTANFAVPTAEFVYP
jgi:hypothetical protein